MPWSRLPLVVAAVACAACDRTHLATTAGNIDVTPSALAFGDVALTTTKSLAVTLHNESLSPQTGHLSAPAPFALERDVTVGGGTSIDVEVVFAPTQVAPATATLTFMLGSAAVEVALTGNGTPAPFCAPPIDCHTCDGAAQADGTSCTSANACLSGGTCHQGVCLGVTRSCDDSNACTADFCDSSGGCSHVDTSSQCPAPSDPCAAAFCDAVKGCSSAPAVDGTSCGPNDCVTAHVCLSGQCKAMAVPEGFACSGANPCQGAGVCHHGSCALPLAQPLTEAWRYTPSGATEVYFDGVTDSSGNLYWLECVYTGFGGNSGGRTNCNLVSYTSNGTPRFNVPHSASEGTPIRQLIVAGAFVSATQPASVQASSLSTGALLWQFDLPGVTGNTPPATNALITAIASDGTRLQGFFTQITNVMIPSQSLGVQSFNATLAGVVTNQAAYASGGSALVLDLFGNSYSNAGLANQIDLTATNAAGASLFSVENVGGQPVATNGNDVVLVTGAVRSTADGSQSSAAPAWFTMPGAPTLMSSTERWQIGSTSGCIWCQECDCAGPITPVTLRAYAGGSTSPAFDAYIADLQLPTAPVLLSTSSVLVASRKQSDTATYLRAIDLQGNEAFACALPEPAPIEGNSTEYSGSVSLADGKWAVVHRDHCSNCVRDPTPYIQVFSVAGLTEADSGWTSGWGGPDRRGQPH